MGIRGNAVPFEAQKEKVLADLKSLGADFAAGLDPSQPSKVYAALGGNPLGTTLVVFDRSGKAAWFQNDPSGGNAGVALSVLSRLLAEPAPKE